MPKAPRPPRGSRKPREPRKPHDSLPSNALSKGRATRSRAARAKRVAVKLLAGLGLGGLFATSLLVGAVLHVNVPAARRVATNLVARFLTQTFHGSVTLGTIERLGLGGTTVSEAIVTDEDGTRVLVLSDLRVRTSVPTLIKDVLFAEDKITIIIRHIRAERAEVQVVPDPLTGIPTIGRALTPVPTPRKEPSTPSAPKKPIRVWLPSIEIAHIYARGAVAGSPTLEVTLGKVGGSVLATQKGVAVDVLRYGLTVRGLGGTDATGTGDLHIRAPGAIWGSYDGFFGNLPVSASVQLKGDKLTTSVDIPKARPEDVRVLLPEWPLQQAVGAHVEASGKLPELQTNARFEIEGASITANGPMRFAPGFSVDLDVQGRSVDLRALWPEAPGTKVNVDTAVSIIDKRGQIVVDVNGTTAQTQILGQKVPPVDVNGTFNEKGFVGEATLHEEGMPLKVDFTVHPSGIVDMNVRARSFQMERAPRVAALTKARGRADVTVKARLDRTKLDATLTGDVSNFSLEDVKLARSHVTGRAKGDITEPGKLSIDAKLVGSALAARGMEFDTVRASAVGPVLRPRVTAKLEDDVNPNIDARGILQAKGKPGVRDVVVSVKRDSVALGGKIASLDFDAQEVQLEELSLTGAGGDLIGAARIGPGRVELKAKGSGLDLDVVAKALGLPRGMLGGRLNVDADVVATRRESHGHVRLGLGNGSIAQFGGIALNVDAELDGKRIRGKAAAFMRDVGGVGASWDGKLAGNAADPASWAGIIGNSEIQFSDVDLSMLRHVLPKAARVEKISGTAFARVKVERKTPEALPNIRVEMAGTRQLKVVRTAEQEGAEPTVIEGIEVLTIGTGINGEKGDISGTTQLVDSHGALLTATLSTRLDLRQLLAEPDDWLSQVSEAPLLLVVSSEDRPLAHLPKQLQPEGVTGSIRGRVMASGSLMDLHLNANGALLGLRTTGSERTLPVDVEASGEYHVANSRYGLNVKLIAAKQRVALLTARGTADIGDGSWTTGAQLALEGVPLSVVPALAESYVDGRLDGTVALQRPKADEPPRLSANVDLNQASVDRMPLGKGSVSVRSDGELVRADLQLDDANGKVTADLRAALDWSAGIPALDRARPVRVSAEAKGYDAAVLSPFLRDLFSRLTGKIDGAVSLVLETPKDASGKPIGDWESRMSGKASLRDGVIQIAELGLELTDVGFDVAARAAGRLSVIEIRDVVGKARSEIPNVRAMANLYLDGVRVVRGNASLRVEQMPVLFQGVSQATATGFATLKLDHEDDRMLVTVDIPNLVARLPQSSGRSVVDIGDNPAIAVVQPLREPRPERTGGILPWRFVVNLRSGVRLKRSDIDIPIKGQPVVDLGKKTVVGGFVELEPGGRVQAWGKTFVVDTGRVIFDTPDPADPHVAAAASWRGPEGTIVYVDVRGTFKNAKIAVSSDPPLSEPEIMALLFGGSAGGSEESSGTRSRESAAAGGLATAFNTLFADALVGSVELRTATNEDKASYTAAVRVAENVWFEGTYRNRLEAQQEAGSTEPVDVSGTIDWRFRKNWSLRTEVGTLGTGLDLLFQYRY